MRHTSYLLISVIHPSPVRFNMSGVKYVISKAAVSMSSILKMREMILLVSELRSGSNTFLPFNISSKVEGSFSMLRYKNNITSISVPDNTSICQPLRARASDSIWPLSCHLVPSMLVARVILCSSWLQATTNEINNNRRY